MLFLGVDAGTTALKVGLFDANGSALTIASEEYALVTPSADWVEIDPENYWRALTRAVHAVIAAAPARVNEIAALAISSQGETVIAADENGRALYPAMVWLDNRAHIQAEKISAQFNPREVYAATGNPEIVPMWTACKILWLKENESQVFARAHKFLFVADFLLHRLTGRFVTDGTLACSSLLWDARRNDWWDAMLACVGISRERLAEPVAPGASVGTLTRDAANELGLPQKIVVVAGGMDQSAGAVGAGNIRPGIVSESTGGALTIQATIATRDLDPHQKIPVNVHALPGAFFFVAVCPTGGMTLRWFRDHFAQEEARRAREQNRDAYQLLDEIANTVEPGCEGLTMLPHLMGAFSPEHNAHARGVFAGFTLRHTKAHFMRAILEASAFMLKRNLDALQALGISAPEIFCTGGGAHSSLWLQIKADVLNKPVATLAHNDTAILGSAILAAVAVGAHTSLADACAAMVHRHQQIEPRAATRVAYADAFARYCALYDQLYASKG
ncbi:MAG: hypothetical protein HZC40_10690 [Chloroflexi bacterium]|nr:hypothetical protein [Chloroflexota bacterium]